MAPVTNEWEAQMIDLRQLKDHRRERKQIRQLLSEDNREFY
jgi:hypothetical protein